ncbi:hypothetical protein MRB53_038743 [Persea americana]|nr:hypothetical protein MRB53_038743 [Persea americana]
MLSFHGSLVLAFIFWSRCSAQQVASFAGGTTTPPVSTATTTTSYDGVFSTNTDPCSPIPGTTTTTISTNAQATSLPAPCKVFPDSIAIAMNTSESLNFDIKEIYGNLVVNSTKTLINVNFPLLTTINGLFSVVGDSRQPPIMAMPKLSHMDGIYWEDWPNIDKSTFGPLPDPELVIGSESVEIYNTGLQSLGLNLTSPESVRVTDNDYLGMLHLEGVIAGELEVTGNGGENNTEYGTGLSLDARWLVECDNITVSDVREVDFSYLNGANDLTITNTTISSLDLISLNILAGSISITNNPLLGNVQISPLPVLSYDAVFTNNPNLTFFNALTNTQSFSGNVTIDGNFSMIEFSSAKHFDGHLNIKSTSSDFVCPNITSTNNTLRTAGTLSSTFASNATFSCKGVNSTSTYPLAISAQGKQTGELSVGAQAGIGVGIGLAVLALLGGLVFFLWRRRQKRRQFQSVKHDGGSEDGAAYGKAELDSSSAELRYGELPGQRDVGELDGDVKQYPRVEIDSKGLVTELNGQPKYEELPGSEGVRYEMAGDNEWTAHNKPHPALPDDAVSAMGDADHMHETERSPAISRSSSVHPA